MKKFLIVFLVVPVILMSVNTKDGNEFSERFFQIGEIWGKIKFFSPYINLNDTDWNKAFTDAYQLIKTADKDEVAAIVNNELLSKLNDPFAGALSTGYADSKATNSFSVEPDSVIVLHLNDWKGSDIDSLTTMTIEQSKTHKGLILDIRNLRGYDDKNIQDTLNQNDFFSNLITIDLPRPAIMTIHYDGYPNEFKNNPFTGSMHIDTDNKMKAQPDGVSVPIIILYSHGEKLSDDILTLRSNKKCMLIAEKGNHLYLSKGENVIENDYGKFRFSHTLPIFENNIKPVLADHTADKTKNQELIDLAVAMLSNFEANFKKDEYININSVFQYISEFHEDVFPSEAERVMGVLKFYTVLNQFFPHKGLITKDLEEETKKFIQKAANCQDIEEYTSMIKEMSCLLEDSHSYVVYKADRSNRTVIPIICKWVENNAVISDVYNKELTDSLNLHVGDIVLEKDGNPIEEFLSNEERYISGSRKETQRRNSIRKLPLGKKEEEFVLKVKKQSGEEVTVKKTYQKFKADDEFRKKYMIKFEVLSDSVLYINAFKIKGTDLDTLYSILPNYDKLIFDLRGYPRFFEVDSILVRLSKNEIFKWANSEMRDYNLVDNIKKQNNVETRTSTKYSFIFNSTRIYDASIAVLVNEDTQSYSEALAQSAQYNCGAVLVGSNTAGANQVVTFMKLPGNIALSFTGANALLWNDKTMQKGGLTPDIEVRPTIKGIRENRDEVLERALLYLKEK